MYITAPPVNYSILCLSSIVHIVAFVNLLLKKMVVVVWWICFYNYRGFFGGEVNRQCVRMHQRNCGLATSSSMRNPHASAETAVKIARDDRPHVLHRAVDSFLQKASDDKGMRLGRGGRDVSSTTVGASGTLPLPRRSGRSVAWYRTGS